MNSTQDRPSLLRDLKIHQFHMDQNAPCLSFQFLLSITVVPREIKDSGYSIFLFFGWGQQGALAIRGRLDKERKEGGGVRASVYYFANSPPHASFCTALVVHSRTLLAPFHSASRRILRPYISEYPWLINTIERKIQIAEVIDPDNETGRDN